MLTSSVNCQYRQPLCRDKKNFAGKLADELMTRHYSRPSSSARVEDRTAYHEREFSRYARHHEIR
jgi:hypothetical protein